MTLMRREDVCMEEGLGSECRVNGFQEIIVCGSVKREIKYYCGRNYCDLLGRRRSTFFII